MRGLVLFGKIEKRYEVLVRQKIHSLFLVLDPEYNIIFSMISIFLENQ